jgi:hypothetical protein
MLFFYKYDRTKQHGVLPNDFNVVFRKIIMPLNSFHSVLWHIFSFFKGEKYYEYQVLKNGEVVSVAQVCPKNLFFRFVPKNGWHIGPCSTIKSQRGNGFYPLLLQFIVQEHPERDYYMIIDERNISSQKGVDKAGFEKFAVGKKNCIGQYCIESSM